MHFLKPFLVHVFFGGFPQISLILATIFVIIEMFITRDCLISTTYIILVLQTPDMSVFKYLTTYLRQDNAKKREFEANLTSREVFFKS